MVKTEKAFVIGFAAGDALGVPVEFATRGQLQNQPIKEMIGYGNHWQVPGTWSDDTSLTVARLIRWSVDMIRKILRKNS